MPDAILFENVTKAYGDTPAVNNLSLSVKAGELVVLLGPSGCGKTTTLRMINRLETPTSGRILVNGKDIAEQSPETLRRGIGYVIQATGLFPHLTVSQNIEVVPRLLGWPKRKRAARTKELLRLVRLEPDTYASRYPEDLSGGEQQRVGVARALAADPPLLLMDEPFGAVDPLTRGRLQEEFRELQRRLGKTVVFVTHDLDEAVALGDRICLMRAGEVEQFASPGELLGAPATPFVERFVGPLRALKRLSAVAVAKIMRPLNGATEKRAGEHAAPPEGRAAVTPEDDLRTALAALLAEAAEAVPVMEESGELVGEVRLADILTAGRRT